MNIDLKHGDCLQVLKDLPDNSIDSIVTDPPYGLKFMSKKWDYDVPSVDIWKECLRVLKPGGHLLSFSGSRTYHRMAVRIEDAGFEIRDQIMWIYGSGFPKGKAQLKPAHEPIVMARKPGPIIPLNIDDCRIEYKDDKPHSVSTIRENEGNSWNKDYNSRTEDWVPNNTGRWPANIILDEEAGQVLDQQSGITGTGKKKIGKLRKGIFNDTNQIFGKGNKPNQRIEDYGDKGGASRFFYCPKASKKDRDEGMNEFPDFKKYEYGNPEKHSFSHMVNNDSIVKNSHPTVKPTDLMLYLIKLVTPKDGIVLDPFMGSGSTGKAAIRGGYNFIGIEREEEYIKISEARINYERQH